MTPRRAILCLALVTSLAVAATLVADIFTTADPPQPITDNTGTLVDCQTITVPANTIITELEVEITAAHSWVGDVTFELTSPSSTTLTLVNRPGRTGTGSGNSDDYQNTTPIRISDVAPSGASAETIGDAPCGGVINGTADCPDNYLPDPDATDTPIAGSGTDLSDFDGESALGVWTLCAGDSASGDTGTLTSWRLGVNMPVPVELTTFSVD